MPIGAGSWAAGPALTIGKSQAPYVQISPGGDVYAFGGLEPGGTGWGYQESQNVQRYFSNDSPPDWLDREPLSDIAVTATNRQPLLIGGHYYVVLVASGYTTAVYLSTDSWTLASYSSLPGVVENAGIVFQLNDGRFILIGGSNGGNTILGNWSLFPTWTTAGPTQLTPRLLQGFPSSVMLPDNTILAVGGFDTSLFEPSAACEILDAGATTWTATGSLITARTKHATVILQSGKVMAIGGVGPLLGSILSSCEIYDPATGLWTAAASMATARFNANVLLLPDGTVFVAGGEDAAGHSIAGAEIYDPLTDSWTSIASMGTARLGHGLALVSDPSGPGPIQVMAFGGEISDGDVHNILATTEIWTAGSSTVPPTELTPPLDFTRRILDLLPRDWASDDAKKQPASPTSTTGVLWSLVNTLAQQYAYAKNNGVDPLGNNERLATADGLGVDNFAQDFFGTSLLRKSGESDVAFKARVSASLLVGGATRAAMITALTRLTGVAPRIQEPWRPKDSVCIAGQAQVSQVGTVGTAQYKYLVQAIGVNGQAAATLLGVTATGNATLNGSHYNTISWPIIAGAVSYTVFRLAGGSNGTGVLGTTTSTTFNDQGATGDGTALPSPGASYWGIDTATTPFRWGAQQGAGLSVTPVGTSGTSQWAYEVVARDGGGRVLQTFLGWTLTGRATLNGSNYNDLAWPAVAGAARYDVYRINSPNSVNGKLFSIVAASGASDTGGGVTPEGAPSNGGMPYQALINTAIPTQTVTLDAPGGGWSPANNTPTAANNHFYYAYSLGALTTSGGISTYGSGGVQGSWNAPFSLQQFTPEDVYSLINAVRPEGTTIWVNILSAAALAALTA